MARASEEAVEVPAVAAADTASHLRAGAAATLPAATLPAAVATIGGLLSSAVNLGYDSLGC